ncbi:polyhydroxyalkanoate depolymerase [Enterovirga aerilata]|uniref:Polyhydroxyalkanoate depolymerase n=1 Tax=Enterovirga aerilata TaxID=2730920 RepID=A0A849IAL0_9HYPH|nr:polyhydroxyalkanoate depolymerase [Enterovirga sp. DB1703]
MLYEAYDIGSDAADRLRTWGRAVHHAWSPWTEAGYREPATWFTAAGEMMMRAGLTHRRPGYGIDTVTVGNRDVPVTEEPAHRTPFGTLTHFRKDLDQPQPRVLVVAPLSGHFATLLRHTVRTLLADHDVYITDWTNARDVPLPEGRFGFDEYVDHLVGFVESMGPGSHVVAVCQPAVQALAAAALMAETKNPASPASITLMAGPVDISVNPTMVNELATGRPIAWFERNLIATVPARYAGAGRRVYPGFVQLFAFMSMNADRHMKGHLDLFWHLVRGETVKALQIKTFYDEYFAVLDLAAEFYLETVERVFQKNLLAQNKLPYRGRILDMRSIRRTALMTVEGERDDICSVGQTVAAHDLCSGLRPYMKRHHLQAGVGHYGVFSGRKWEGQVYPLLRNFIQANN